MSVQKTPTQKTCKISIDTDSINVESLIFNKSDKHTTIYDSYNVELAANYIISVKLSNFTEIYSLTNKKNYDTHNLTQKHLLYKQFVTWNCNGCSTAPLSDYINNSVYQELIEEGAYDGARSNEKLYLDLRAGAGYTAEIEKLERNDSKVNVSVQLKDAATKKLRLRIWAYSLG